MFAATCFGPIGPKHVAFVGEKNRDVKMHGTTINKTAMSVLVP
jgi:hypothetical protein